MLMLWSASPNLVTHTHTHTHTYIQTCSSRQCGQPPLPPWWALSLLLRAPRLWRDKVVTTCVKDHVGIVYINNCLHIHIICMYVCMYVCMYILMSMIGCCFFCIILRHSECPYICRPIYNALIANNLLYIQHLFLVFRRTTYVCVCVVCPIYASVHVCMYVWVGVCVCNHSCAII